MDGFSLKDLADIVVPTILTFGLKYLSDISKRIHELSASLTLAAEKIREIDTRLAGVETKHRNRD